MKNEPYPEPVAAKRNRIFRIALWTIIGSWVVLILLGVFAAFRFQLLYDGDLLIKNGTVADCRTVFYRDGKGSGVYRLVFTFTDGSSYCLNEDIARKYRINEEDFPVGKALTVHYVEETSGESYLLMGLSDEERIYYTTDAATKENTRAARQGVLIMGIVLVCTLLPAEIGCLYCVRHPKRKETSAESEG